MLPKEPTSLPALGLSLALESKHAKALPAFCLEISLPSFLMTRDEVLQNLRTLSSPPHTG